MSLNRWARAFLLMGAIMSAIGIVPLLIVGTLIPNLKTVLPDLLFFLVTPIGVFILIVGIILWLVALIRK